MKLVIAAGLKGKHVNQITGRNYGILQKGKPLQLRYKRVKLHNFQARSQNFEKRFLASSCLSVCPHGKTRLPLDGFSWNLILE
jgi:hypothetical protein